MIELVFQPDVIIQLNVKGCKHNCSCNGQTTSDTTSSDDGNAD